MQNLEGEQAFRPNSFCPKVFNKDKLVYGEDVELKAVNLFLFRKLLVSLSLTYLSMKQDGRTQMKVERGLTDFLTQ
jgi:hypothetical protein